MQRRAHEKHLRDLAEQAVREQEEKEQAAKDHANQLQHDQPPQPPAGFDSVEDGSLFLSSDFIRSFWFSPLQYGLDGLGLADGRNSVSGSFRAKNSVPFTMRGSSCRTNAVSDTCLSRLQSS